MICGALRSLRCAEQAAKLAEIPLTEEPLECVQSTFEVIYYGEMLRYLRVVVYFQQLLCLLLFLIK